MQLVTIFGKFSKMFAFDIRIFELNLLSKSTLFDKNTDLKQKKRI